MKSFARNLVIVSFLVSTGCTFVYAQSEMRPDVHRPLIAAQEALKANQFEQALRLAGEAAAIPELTSVEKQFAWRLQAIAAVRTQQLDLAIDRLDRLLALTEIPASDRLALQEMLVNVSVQKKDTSRTIKAAQDYLQAGGINFGVRTALLQSLSVQGDHQRLIEQMDIFIQQDSAQKRKTPELELRLMGAAAHKLKDPHRYFSVLKRLLDLYPSKSYWADAISRLTNLPNFNGRYELDAYRLLAETDNLEESSEFTEMINLALKAGLPAEALRTLENGLQKGVLGQGEAAPALTRLLNEIKKKNQEDEALLPQLEQGAKDGNAWSALAEAHAAKQNWPAAQTAYEKAFSLGELRRQDESVLRRGIALLKGGNKEQALMQWRTLQGDNTAAQLASLWILLAR